MGICKKIKANTIYIYFHCACYINSNNLFKILNFEQGDKMNRIDFLKNYIKNLKILRESTSESNEHKSLTAMLKDYEEELFELENPIKKVFTIPKSNRKITITLKTGELVSGYFLKSDNTFMEDKWFKARNFEWSQEYIDSWVYC